MIEKLGGYNIVSELGRGGMGMVLKAYDPSLDRHVAIKILNQSMITDQTLIARFKREARSAASLNHPNIVQIHALGEEQGQSYFVMELVEGESLSQLLRRKGKLSPQNAAHILRQVAAGLAVAHDKDIVHRDVKPANIMITPQGLVKVADFGIAFVYDPTEKLTMTGQFMGTPGYISPEMCTGLPIDLRSDIFSLGIVYFEMLAGTQPFQSDSMMEMINQVVKTDLPDIRRYNPEVDETTLSVLARMSAKNRDERFQNCHQIISALEAIPAPGNSFTGYLGAAPVPTGDMEPTEVLSQPPLPPTVASQNDAALVQPTPNDAPTVRVQSPENKAEAAYNQPTVATPPPIPEEASQTAAKDPFPQQAAAVVAPPPRARSKWPLLAAVLLLIAVAVGLGFKFGIGNERDTGPDMPVAEIEGDLHNEPDDPQDPESPPLEEDLHESAMVGKGGNQSADVETDPDHMGSLGEETENVETLAKSGSSTEALENRSKSLLDSKQTLEGGQSLQIKGTGDQDQKSSLSMETTTTADQPMAVTGTMPDQPKTLTAPKLEAEHNRPSLPKRAFPKGDPHTAVIAAGDPLLADALELAMEEYLDQDKVRLMDEEELDEFDGFDMAAPVMAGPVGEAVYAGGGDVLILIEAKPAGQRRVNAGGRSSTLYTAAVKVRCYRLPGREKLGKTFKKDLEYNTLTATRVAEEAMRRLSSELNRILKKQEP